MIDYTIPAAGWQPGACARTRLRRLDPAADAPLLHAWFTQPRAAFWGMQHHSPGEVEKVYADMQASGHALACIGEIDGRAAFVLECYDPARDPLGRHFDVRPGDVGMHFFVAPVAEGGGAVPGFTRHVFRSLMQFIFGHLRGRRVVVEPDIRNTKVHALNAAMGFAVHGPATLPHKTALLSSCTLAQFERATAIQAVPSFLLVQPTTMTSSTERPDINVNHLSPEVWQRANRHLVRKAIAEFSHEQVLRPEPLGRARADGWQRHRLVADDAQAVYEFEAQRLPLRHWRIDARSIEKTRQGAAAPLDALQFIIEFKQTMGFKPELLPIYLEEISSTLYGAAYKLTNGRRASAALVDADFQEIEAAMSEGHPGFVANNGRIGFDAVDYTAYTPEAGARFAVVWLAVRRSHAEFNAVSGLSHEQLLAEELGPSLLKEFRARLRAMNLDPQDYWLMPAHPWQWANKLAIGFAADVANRNIVHLGSSEDLYQAQQSIRTFFNASCPTRRYVKTSLSILNMGFMRGLSPYYMSGTPAINEWVHAVVSQDASLRDYGFMVLREVASIGFRNRYLESAVDKDSAYRKMFSALWRESPLPLLAPGQKLMSMTALVHVDARGEALVAHLIQRSGLEAKAWMRRYLRAFLAPMLHCFYAHDLVFMPHGENLILVMENHLPVRALMKDIGEECAVFDDVSRLGERIGRIAVEMPDEFRLLFLFIDVFDGFFRHLQQVLAEAGCMQPGEFWQLVAECAHDYQRAHPQFAAKFERFDLFTPTFEHSCLNRLQLWNNTHMLNLADPASGLKFAEPLQNPIAAFARRPGREAGREAVATEA